MSEVFFSGTAGLIEGRYSSFTEVDGAPVNIAAVFAPNPLFGGTMQNKVVYTLYQSIALAGFATLRANFRGVGRSAGTVSGDLRELQEHALQDATSAMDWLQMRNKGFAEFWVIGFSFGAWVAMQAAMRRPEVTGMILVCPPVGKYDLGFLSPCPVPCAVIHAEDDAVVSQQEVLQFVLSLNKNRYDIAEYYLVNNTNHFFNAALPELSRTVVNYAKYRLASGEFRRESPGFRERKRRRRAPVTAQGGNKVQV